MKYLITEKAGEWIAGMKSPGVGAVIELTPAQAEYELIRGVLSVLPDADASPEPVVQLPPLTTHEKKGKRK